jgi:uncharacterized membrane protein YdjX (TVP38/TMEM64 family)
VKRPLLIAAIATAAVGMSIVAVPMFGLADTILRYGDALRSDPDLIARYYVLLLLIYFVAYTASVALCLPLTALMAAVGGWLFGLWSLPVAVLSIVAGSIVPFLLSRRYAGPALAKIDSATVDRLRRGFDRNQVQYLILMRLVPWAPFTVTTIVAGALGMRLTKFLIGTALGFLPAGLALNAIGHGLARLTDLSSLSAAQLYRDPDFLMAGTGVVLIAVVMLLKRIPLMARLLDQQ